MTLSFMRQAVRFSLKHPMKTAHTPIMRTNGNWVQVLKVSLDDANKQPEAKQ